MGALQLDTISLATACSMASSPSVQSDHEALSVIERSNLSLIILLKINRGHVGRLRPIALKT